MYLLVDNYDSFVFNLKAYVEELGHEVLVFRDDEITPEHAEELQPEGIIISPGPKTPDEAEGSIRLVKAMAGRIPILGVCLGHQIIGRVFGADVTRGPVPMHGKVSPVDHSGKRLFRGLPQRFGVTRYHSLIVTKETLPAELIVDAETDDGSVMAISSDRLGVYGIQFHPEAVLTEYGHELIENFCDICEEWRCDHA